MVVDIPNIQMRYYEHSKYRSRIEYNYILSHIETFVAFIPADKGSRSWISVLNTNYIPLVTFEIQANIHSCNISPNGKYIVCITASNIDNESNDGDSIFLFDIENKTLVWRIEAPIHARYLCSMHVFDEQDEVLLIYDDIKINYDMDGNEKNPDLVFKNMLKSDCVSSFYWINQALKIIECLNNEYSHGVEREVLIRIKAAEEKSITSTYQLSQTYRRLADCYLKYDFKHKALNSYRMALSYNDKIGVKRIIAKLEKELQN